MFTIKRKLYALLADGSGKSIKDFHQSWKDAGGLQGTGKSFKEYYRGSAPTTQQVGRSVISQAGTGSALANENKRVLDIQNQAAERRKNALAIDEKRGFRAGCKKGYNAGYKQGAATGYNAGQNSVGIMGGIKNTWNKAGTMGKIGMGAAGLAAAGTMAYGISNMLSGNKKKED